MGNLLELRWKDNRQEWELRPDGAHEQRRPPAEAPEHAREITRAG